MTVILKSEADLIVPASVRRQAGIGPGDKVRFTAAPGIITIVTSAPPRDAYTPTKSEKARIRSGRAAIQARDYVTLEELPDALVAEVRASRAKGSRKVSR